MKARSDPFGLSLFHSIMKIADPYPLGQSNERQSYLTIGSSGSWFPSGINHKLIQSDLYAKNKNQTYSKSIFSEKEEDREKI